MTEVYTGIHHSLLRQNSSIYFIFQSSLTLHPTHSFTPAISISLFLLPPSLSYFPFPFLNSPPFLFPLPPLAPFLTPISTIKPSAIHKPPFQTQHNTSPPRHPPQTPATLSHQKKKFGIPVYPIVPSLLPVPVSPSFIDKIPPKTQSTF